LQNTRTNDYIINHFTVIEKGHQLLEG